jgi:hypothetical protein
MEISNNETSEVRYGEKEKSISVEK